MMFKTRCVPTIALVASLGACDRSNDAPEGPPRATAHDAMEAFAAPDADTTGGDDEELLDDYLPPSHDGDDTWCDDDLGWFDDDGDDEYQDTWVTDGWEANGCEEPDEPVCDAE